MTLALFAISELVFFAFLAFAAVTAIPAAFLGVVVIVADAITLVFCNSTSGCLERRVQTFAFEAVIKLPIIAIVTTAVTTVPATSAAVVVVVTEFIALVFWRTALSFALQCLMVFFCLYIRTPHSIGTDHCGRSYSSRRHRIDIQAHCSHHRRN